MEKVRKIQSGKRVDGDFFEIDWRLNGIWENLIFFIAKLIFSIQFRFWCKIWIILKKIWFFHCFSVAKSDFLVQPWIFKLQILYFFIQLFQIYQFHQFYSTPSYHQHFRDKFCTLRFRIKKPLLNATYDNNKLFFCVCTIEVHREDFEF